MRWDETRERETTTTTTTTSAVATGEHAQWIRVCLCVNYARIRENMRIYYYDFRQPVLREGPDRMIWFKLRLCVCLQRKIVTCVIIKLYYRRRRRRRRHRYRVKRNLFVSFSTIFETRQTPVRYTIGKIDHPETTTCKRRLQQVVRYYIRVPTLTVL